MEEGFEFLLKVFNSTAYLEEVSGLSRLHHCVDDSQVNQLGELLLKMLYFDKRVSSKSYIANMLNHYNAEYLKVIIESSHG